MTMPAESPRHAPPSARSQIAQDVTITGDIGSEGTVEIAGRVEGKVAARVVVLGPEGIIRGAISAETVDLRGSVEGKISCVGLTLRASSQVKADVNYHTLAIESGATIEGQFARATS